MPYLVNYDRAYFELFSCIFKYIFEKKAITNYIWMNPFAESTYKNLVYYTKFFLIHKKDLNTPLLQIHQIFLTSLFSKPLKMWLLWEKSKLIFPKIIFFFKCEKITRDQIQHQQLKRALDLPLNYCLCNVLCTCLSPTILKSHQWGWEGMVLWAFPGSHHCLRELVLPGAQSLYQNKRRTFEGPGELRGPRWA